jgi:hypothetical protein
MAVHTPNQFEPDALLDEEETTVLKGEEVLCLCFGLHGCCTEKPDTFFKWYALVLRRSGVLEKVERPFRESDSLMGTVTDARVMCQPLKIAMAQPCLSTIANREKF